MSNYDSFSDCHKYVTVANGTRVPVLGQGTCGILCQVYYVPDLSHSLLSVNSLTSDGMTVKFDDDYAIISKGVSPFVFDPIKAVKLDGLYKLSQVLIYHMYRVQHENH